MMECGQYNPLWSEIHMFPEETAQAGLDVRAKKVMPIHWGSFKLAPHSWLDPIQRVTVKAQELNVELVIPEIGKPTPVNLGSIEYQRWWQDY
jgi:L-ascorbate metabolism protein UlaG (beta-lactamase superfamily)